MSSTEKQTTDVTTMENHAPVPPALDKTTAKDTQTAAPSAAPSADGEITTLENHAPVPPALDLGGK
ncbi:sigma-like protein [Streptomyces sp. NPDC054794]